MACPVLQTCSIPSWGQDRGNQAGLPRLWGRPVGSLKAQPQAGDRGAACPMSPVLTSSPQEASGQLWPESCGLKLQHSGVWWCLQEPGPKGRAGQGDTSMMAAGQVEASRAQRVAVVPTFSMSLSEPLPWLTPPFCSTSEQVHGAGLAQLPAPPSRAGQSSHTCQSFPRALGS